LSCDIKLKSTLTISKTLTLSGQGHQVTLDGQHAVQVLQVNGGVTLTLKALTVANGFGNGIFSSGTVSITNSMVSGNGNGIFSSGTVSITNSTVSGNGTDNFGGGIFNEGGTVSITNSTVSGNSDRGIFNGGTLSIINSTVSGNSIDGIFNGGRMRIGGSIVANNTGSNCNGILTDQGYNLSNDSSCHFTASTSLRNTDPKFDPAGLQNNGGPTKTIALQPDSPAVDKIPVGSQCPATDQRGVPRPQGPTCDIGAFEMTAADGLRVMIHVVDSFHLAKGLQNSLDHQLQAVLADLRAQQIAQACRDLTSFINHVKAQSGKSLTTAQATKLLTEAAVIHTRLGC
jgi:hypothetical protein